MQFGTARFFALVCVMVLVCGCDEGQPLAPAVQAASTGVPGPAVKPPSNTNAVAASDSRIDVSWQDNSANEAGFEVHRSASGPSGAFALLASTAAGVTSYGDAGLTSSTQYCYKVRAFKRADGRTSYSDFSNTACATTSAPPPPPGPPNAPSGSNATPTNSSQVWVTWTDNSGNEDGFRVERAATNTGPWEAFRTTSRDVKVAIDDGRTSEQEVCYRVIAFNAQGGSPPSNADCTTPPAGPTNLTAIAVDPQTIDLAWADNSAVEDGYAVARRTAVDPYYSVVASLPANATGYRDAGLSTNTTYWYWVAAKKDDGSSTGSNVASAATASEPPNAPSATGARPTSGSAVDVTWLDNSPNEEGFRVERSADAGVSWTVVGTTPAEFRWLIDGPLPSEQHVCYRVIAFNSVGDSPPSNTDCTMPPAQPGDLTWTQVDDRTADLAWTDNSGVEDGYEVCRMASYQEGWFFIAGLPANSTSYRDSARDIGEAYAYIVVAHKDGGPTCFDYF